jgi:hypothetical protein
MRRREFISIFDSTAVAWRLIALAQQPAMPRLAVLYSYQISGRILWSIYRPIAAAL